MEVLGKQLTQINSIDLSTEKVSKLDSDMVANAFAFVREVGFDRFDQLCELREKNLTVTQEDVDPPQLNDSALNWLNNLNGQNLFHIRKMAQTRKQAMLDHFKKGGDRSEAIPVFSGVLSSLSIKTGSEGFYLVEDFPRPSISCFSRHSKLFGYKEFFEQCDDLTDLDLRQLSGLRGTDFRKAKVNGLDLTGSDVSGAKFPPGMQDNMVICDATVINTTGLELTPTTQFNEKTIFYGSEMRASGWRPDQLNDSFLERIDGIKFADANKQRFSATVLSQLMLSEDDCLAEAAAQLYLKHKERFPEIKQHEMDFPIFEKLKNFQNLREMLELCEKDGYTLNNIQTFTPVSSPVKTKSKENISPDNLDI
jgi:hypothetical protein